MQRSAGVLVVVCLLAGRLSAQTTAPAGAEQEVPKFTESVSVGYVMIPFTALDPYGVPLTNVRSRDVSVYVDGERVRPDLFEKSENAPVSFTILLDGSGSMALAGKMENARAAIYQLLGRRRPGDEFSLYVFAESEAHEVVPFTKNPVPIITAVKQVKPYGKTAFFDALSTMPDRSGLGSNPSRAIILLSDGIDNASRLTRNDLARLLQGVAVPIYPLGLRSPAEEKEADESTMADARADFEILGQVAELTGGRMFVGDRPDDLAQAITAMDKMLRAQYLVGFSPTGKGAVKYRRISVKVAGRVESVRVRAGYIGSEPPPFRASRRSTR